MTTTSVKRPMKLLCGFCSCSCGSFSFPYLFVSLYFCINLKAPLFSVMLARQCLSALINQTKQLGVVNKVALFVYVL
jgi:hypothetical protein